MPKTIYTPPGHKSYLRSNFGKSSEFKTGNVGSHKGNGAQQVSGISHPQGHRQKTFNLAECRII